MRAISVRRLVPLGFALFIAVLIGIPMLSIPMWAQFVPAHALITQRIDDSKLTTLRGNTHPLARTEFDLGTAPATMPMRRMLLVLKRSPEQENALAQMLDDQQNKNSPSYHKWLSPEDFGQQFGPTDSDLQAITSWLQSHGFEVGTTKGRTVLEFSGTAGQVQQAFHTTIHNYIVKGERHWANANDPQIPAALTPAVTGIASLNNFPRRPMNKPFGTFTRDKSTGKLTGMPLFTYPGGCDQDNNCYTLGPYDFATIYDLLPLWNAGVSGQNQTIAIVGESNINMQDVTDFRTMFGLTANGFPGNNVNRILNGPDPGPQSDESEADIDVQWSGAVAPNATIDFVVSQSTESTDGIDLSAVYIVENNLAPVMSESYGFCELGLGVSGNQFFNSLWQQAAAQGITVFISSGDDGSAGCDFNQGTTPQPAQYGLAVSGYASTPYNVAVGGTDFNDFSNPTTYWNLTNDPVTQASARGYIPETTWNDSCTNAIFANFGLSSNPETNCNDARVAQFVWTVGASGGASTCTTPTGNTPANCAGGYAKPSWQIGTGVPADGKRDIPDVSLFASNGFLGNFYVICQSDLTYGVCNTTSGYNFAGFGGTSVASPAFAAIMALVNQQTGERQGNANYVFYKLAAQHPGAFHDVTSGTIAMPCSTGSSNCSTTVSGHSYGVLSGYKAGPGYDLATGLGSVDINKLVTLWTSVALAPSIATITSLTPTTITHGQPVSFSVSVKPQTGTGIPTGLISLEGSPTNSIQGITGSGLSNGVAAGSTSMLPGGSYSVIAHYSGDSNYAPSDSAPVTVTVNRESSQTQAGLVTFDWNGKLLSSTATSAVYGSLYLLRMNVANSAGHLCAPVSVSGATGCPTGSVTLADNGASLDAGSYILNSYGYVEDLAVQLPGGANAITAQYSGDNSFNPSSATPTISIAPAPTTDQAPVINSGSNIVGSVAGFSSTVQATSTGVSPTGTMTFYSNGTLIPGATYLQPYQSGSPANNFTASSFGSVWPATSIFPVPGTYHITATYSGDNNYQASASSVAAIVVMFPPPAISIQASSTSVAAGSSVTLTALIGGASTTIAPTGTITFNGYEGPINGTLSYTTVTDPNTGNLDLQGSITFPASFSDNYSAQYAGDSNYPSVQTPGSTLSLTVTGTDFSLLTLPGQNSLTLPPGAISSIALMAGLQSGAAPVTFAANACSGLPKETTCSLFPTSIASTGSFMVTINTTAPHSAAATRSRLLGTGFWPISLMPLAGIILLRPRRRFRWQFFALGMAVSILLISAGCGGSSGGNGGGGGGGFTDPGTPTGNYVITITGTSGSVSHSTTFTLLVQ